ncbi:oxygen-independent coproporphyrinogen III oxidase [Haliea sp. E17]|uniref:oxygen-independent coproporphyrinogen III oxidase n=1 Tax=Haliea sp. E17 TaxID=3401576 RepID=UPI003AAEDB24
MQSTVPFNAALLNKYDTFGPRYTSYPTALQFSPAFTRDDYLAALARSNAGGKPLSLYFHIPYCESLCFYCACNKIITHTRERARPYLENLYREVGLQAERVAGREVRQLHFGGGSPTFLDDEQLNGLLQHAEGHFNFAPFTEREFSIEIDPRTVGDNTIALLRDYGFNRLSLGVQDFNQEVQRAVNRLQSVEQVQAVLDAAARAGYQSVSMDLIYGLPHQTLDSFSQTLETVIGMRPQRLAVYSYAHMPQKVKAQKLIVSETLPDAVTKLGLLELSIQRLQEAGYVYVGMDHFALPEDELVVAMQNGSLQRNFQGYSTHAETDMIAMGVSSIGKVDDCYSQNQRHEKHYLSDLAADQLPVMQGYRLSEDDKLRREVIQRLMCQGEVDLAEIEAQYSVRFDRYFSESLDALAPLAEDGLVQVDSRYIRVLPLGRLLVRNIAMCFDAYIKPAREQRFSRVI